jgi:hypothetical protein
VESKLENPPAPKAPAPHVTCGPLMGVPPSPAFWQALLKAQQAAGVMVRDEETDPKAGRQQWKFSKTESWIKLSREKLHQVGILVVQSAALSPLSAGGSLPVVPVKASFVFTAVHVLDGTGWWWALDWPHYGELRGGPELAWRMSLTLSWKYAIRAILQVPQGDEGDEQQSQDPRSVEGGVPMWQPGVQGYQPDQQQVQPFHGGYQQQGYHGGYQQQGPGAHAQGAPQAPHAHAGGHGYAGGAFPGNGHHGVVGGQNGQAPHVDQEPIVGQAAAMLGAEQLGNVPPAQLQPQQFDAPQQPQFNQGPPQHQPPAGVPQGGAIPQGQNAAQPPRREAPADGGPDPTFEDLVARGWQEQFARRLAALGPNDACPDDLREGFLSSCNAFFAGDKAAQMAPWASTGFTPQIKVPPGQQKPQPKGVHLRRYAVQLDWKQRKQAAPAAAGRQ